MELEIDTNKRTQSISQGNKSTSPTETFQTNLNYCLEHKSELLNFYCDDHQKEICQYCLLESHMGHKIIKPIESDNYKISIANKKLNSIEEDIYKRLDKSANIFKNTCSFLDDAFEGIIQKSCEMKNSLKLDIYDEYKQLKENVLEIDDLAEVFKNDYDKLKKLGVKAINSKQWNDNISKFLKIKENCAHLNIFSSDMKLNSLLIEYSNLVNDKTSTIIKDLNNSTNSQILTSNIFTDIENPMEYLIENSVTHNIKYKLNTPTTNINLVKQCAISCKCTNLNVINVLQSIDRGEFVKNNAIFSAYHDTPLSIGWNTTISAPHMHMFTLNYIGKFIKNLSLSQKENDFKAIDIGSGSGFMTIALSKLLGPYSTTYALDHIQDILDFTKSNIKKSHSNYIENKRINFICDDGLNFKNEEKLLFHVIHVGAACTSIPQNLLDLLLPGGMMWIPVGPKSRSKKMMVVIKNEKGDISKESLMDVNYSEMQSVDEQLNEH